MTLYKALVQGTLASGAERFTTTCHLNTTSNVQTTLDGWVTAVAALFSGGSGIASIMPDTSAVTESSVVSIEPTTGKQIARAEDATTYTGTSANQPQSTQTCALMSHFSANASRGGRGRMYLPAPANNAITDGGLMTPAALTVYVNAANQWFSALSAAQLQLVIYHRASGTFTPVTDVKMTSRYATQRRRANKLPNVYTS